MFLTSEPSGDRSARFASVSESTIVAPPSETSPNDTKSPVSLINLTQLDRTPTVVERLTEKQDVRSDDWDTEVLSDAADQQLANLQSILVNPDRVSEGSVAAFIEADFACQALRPGQLEDVVRNGPITVRRPAATVATSDTPFRGASGFVEALRQLVISLGKAENRQVKFKVTQISKRPQFFVTSVLYEASNHSTAESRQQTATWLCQWSYPTSAGGRAPRLLRVETKQYEEVQCSLAHGHLFVDCTESALADNAAYTRQIVPGIDYWSTRIPREFMGQFGHHGLAVGDVNGDGLDDLYVCDAGGLPNRLFVQQPNGTLMDVSRQSGVNLLENSVSALLLDIDNDGDQDLIVATDQLLQLAENDGSGRFTLRDGFRAMTDSFSLSAADYDMDGNLDVYICGYNARKQDPLHRGLPFPLPYHDANNGGKNFLLRNEGNFRLVDVTQQTGLDVNNRRFSLAAAWEDFDNDGDLDLYVANDFGRNNLYRNDRGHFVDIAATAGVEDHASGMSVSWGDPNRDGLIDLYVGNMFSAAGNRVTYQRRFADGLASQTVSHLRRMARGNTFFVNASTAGLPKFRDESEQAAVAMGRWAWASKFVDLNNDGWQDLVVANGYLTNEYGDDL